MTVQRRENDLDPRDLRPRLLRPGRLQRPARDHGADAGGGRAALPAARCAVLQPDGPGAGRHGRHRPARGELDGAQPAVRRRVHVFGREGAGGRRQARADDCRRDRQTGAPARPRQDRSVCAGWRGTSAAIRRRLPRRARAAGRARRREASAAFGRGQVPPVPAGRYRATLGTLVGDKVTPIGARAVVPGDGDSAVAAAAERPWTSAKGPGAERVLGSRALRRWCTPASGGPAHEERPREGHQQAARRRTCRRSWPRSGSPASSDRYTPTPETMVPIVQPMARRVPMCSEYSMAATDGTIR